MKGIGTQVRVIYPGSPLDGRVGVVVPVPPRTLVPSDMHNYRFVRIDGHNHFFGLTHLEEL